MIVLAKFVNSMLITLLVFGNINPLTKCSGYENTFASWLFKNKWLEIWSLVDADPLTRNFLKGLKVRHEIGSNSGDPLEEKMHSI